MMTSNFFSAFKKFCIFLLINISIFSSPLRVGVCDNFNIELLNFIREKNKDVEIEIIRYENYRNLNRDLREKKIDVNLFQTLDYLNKYNEKNKTSIYPIAKTYIEPVGVYSKDRNSIKELAVGDIIVIGNDPSIRERSLKLLEKIGIIQLKDEKEGITLDSIVKNPFNVKIVEVENYMLHRYLEVANYVVLDGETATYSGFVPIKDSLFLEKFNPQYVNVIAVRKKQRNEKKIIRFVKILEGREARLFTLKKYGDNIKFLYN